MRLGSLCTGYGGLDMGVAAHYATTPAWCSDNDPDCARVLAARFPGVPNLGDLTTVDWDHVEPVDIMCAGFPCQPFSHAGKREGENDERAIFAYIADGIRILRPGIVVLENVAGLLTLGGPGVVGTLTGLGYDDLRWGLVRASDAGAPHRRARWFCVAENTTGQRQLARPTAAVPTTASAGWQVRSTGPNSSPATDSSGERHGGRQDDRVVGHLDGEDRGPRGQPVDRGSEAPTDPDREPRSKPDQRAAAGVEAPQWDDPSRSCLPVPFGPYQPAIRRWERTIGRPAPDPTDDGKLSSRFVEWMMGLPEDHICGLGLPRTAELRTLGNGVVPAQAKLALELLGV